MKTFLKKLFYWDNPAQGVFAGTTLLLVSLWIAPALYLLCGGPMNFRPPVRMIFLVMALLLAVYLLAVFLCARKAQIPFRKMFGRGVQILWGLVAAVYLLSLGMVFVTRVRTGFAVKDLERHFAKPFSVQGLKAFYTNGRKVDTAFWANIVSGVVCARVKKQFTQ